MPPFLPSFIGRNETVTAAPGLSVVRVQPRRARKFGLMPSNAHVSVPPPAFLTSTHTQICGLVQSTLLTVPVTVFSVVRSHGANEWCAEARPLPAASIRHVSAATTPARVI